MPRPADMSLAGDGGVSVEVLSDLGPFAEFIALESKHKKLHRIWTMDWWDKEISKLMQLLGEKKEEACRINQQHVNDPVARMNKQAGVKFYWRRDQEPDLYRIYRSDANSGDKRSVDEICQQELKNAACITLMEKGPQDKESLIKSTIWTIGYARSSSALVAAAEKGLKYGRKTGEIVQNEEKRFLLGN